MNGKLAKLFEAFDQQDCATKLDIIKELVRGTGNFLIIENYMTKEEIISIMPSFLKTGENLYERFYYWKNEFEGYMIKVYEIREENEDINQLCHKLIKKIKKMIDAPDCFKEEFAVLLNLLEERFNVIWEEDRQRKQKKYFVDFNEKIKNEIED